MSTLTNTQIQNTYQGLLKLSNSTTGITSNFQAIEDGLGNDTGVKIATNYLSSPNNPGFLSLKADYYGAGFNTAPVTPQASTQNIIMAIPFYDNGLFDYSAITYNIITATTTSDVWEVSFYTSQMVQNIGLAPHVQLMAPLSLTTNSTGIKTTTFSSPLSFSGYGAGLYWMVHRFSNSGVTPTTRPSGPASFYNVAVQSSINQLGFTYNAQGTAMLGFSKNGASGGIIYSGLTTFNTTFSTSDVATFSTTSGQAFGFGLNTIK